MDVSVRWWTNRDSPQVLDIQRLSGVTNHPKNYFIELLGERTVVGCVAEKGDRVLGYMIYEVFKNRLEVIHFEVHPEFRRQKVGFQMFGNLMEKCQKQDRRFITCVVPEYNMSMCLFLRKMGAVCRQVRRNCFENSNESGYYFEYYLGSWAISQTNDELLNLEGAE